MTQFTALSTPFQTAPAPSRGPSASAGTVPRVVPSQELLAGQKTVEILHNGLLYRLQATRLGKLILTK
ncbi:hemin uptake protein HemP [Curvibacter gracilis]|uniref:hemin uptake protein HemP n=1 Tax=Curvibacter gracilis TaxID=230310 RepID=UPI0004830A10|nr:hemin uptake protein HemP [Curvibacter gracilis]